MKFILNEDLTLEEQELVERKDKNNKSYRKIQYQLHNQQPKNSSKYELTQEQEKALGNYLKSKGVPDSRIESTLEAIRAGKKGSEVWAKMAQNNELGIDQDNKQATQDKQSNQNQEEQTQEEQPQETQGEQQATQQDNAENVAADNNQIEGVTNPVQTKLLNVIKASNDLGYANFLKGIKSNIRNNSFPFTRLMQNPRFSEVLGIRESLDEANVFSNIANQVANGVKNSRASQFVQDKVQAAKETNLGKKIKTGANRLSTFKAKVDPNTFRKFASVYNAFLDNKIDTDYVDDESAIIYDRNLYSNRNFNNIGKAIEIDFGAQQASDDEKRAELKAAVKAGKIDQVSSLEGTKNRNPFEQVLDQFDKLSPEKKKEFAGLINKKLGA